MSGEFGSYLNGYFHHQIAQGAEDCLAGQDEMTRLWGAFLDDFKEVAHAIAYSEAGDAGQDYTVLSSIEKLPQLKDSLKKIEHHLEPYARVMKAAVREALEERKKK